MDELERRRIEAFVEEFSDNDNLGGNSKDDEEDNIKYEPIDYHTDTEQSDISDQKKLWK